MSNLLSADEEKKILKLYKEKGLSCRAIEKCTGRSRPAINRVLADNGIAPSSSLKRSQKYEVKANYFRTIDSHKKAYWLGWLMSDGSVHAMNKGGKTISIGLQKRDAHVLEELRKDIGSNAPIKTQIQTLAGKKHSQRIFRVCNTEMADDLIGYGIVPAKSKINACPINVPAQFVSSFILGEFEGDGCIYTGSTSVRLSIWDTKCVCDFVKREVDSRVGRSIGSVAKKSGSEVYVYSVARLEDIKSVYRLMYEGRDFEFCLARKHQSFQRLFSKKAASAKRRLEAKTSRYLGVCRFRYGKRLKYVGHIQVAGIKHVAGYFDTQTEAAKARDKLAFQLLGNKAVLNSYD